MSMSKKEYFRIYDHTLNGRGRRMLINIKSRCKLKNMQYDLDVKWIMERITKGCALTGMPFELRKEYQAANPLGPSVDRIDSSKGYLKDNCRVVLFCINSFKHTGTDDMIYMVAEALLKNKGEKTVEEIVKEENDQLILEAQMRYVLEDFFTDRQIEIIFKRYNGEPMDRREIELYCRPIKPRLQALSNPTLLQTVNQILTNIV